MRIIGALVAPTTTSAIGFATTLYSAMSPVMSVAFATSWVTIRLLTANELKMKSPVARSICASMSVTSRPWEAAPVTTLPSMTQLTAQFVWPVMTTSISSSIIGTIGGIAPVAVLRSELLGRHVARAVAGRVRAATLVEQDDDGLDALGA